MELTASLTVLKKRFRRIESVSLTVPCKAYTCKEQVTFSTPACPQFTFDVLGVDKIQPDGVA